MSDIIEILGTKKFAGGENKTLKTRVILEEPSKIKDEYNLFTNVSQYEQFIKEKQENDVYKVYGTIIPSVMKTPFFRKTKLNVDVKAIEFTKDNWSMVMCKPVKYLGEEKGRKSFEIKYYDSSSDSDKIFELDLKKGLPASLSLESPFSIRNRRKSEVNVVLYMNLGHNMSVGDQIYINSEDARVTTGTCFIKNVNGNEITTDLTISATDLISAEKTTAKLGNSLSASASVNKPTTPRNKYTNTLRGIQSTDDNNSIVNALKLDRPTPYSLINPKMSVSKVIDNEVLEYYVKQVEVVDVFNAFDECGFSKNLYGDKIYNFYFNKNYDIRGSLDNKDEPTTNCYIGVIKNGSTEEKVFSDVESNFTSLIEYTNEGEGIKTISEKSITEVSNKPIIGNQYDVGIYEYSNENLSEELVESIEHNFIINYVLFKYKPFTEIVLKNKSSYIEDSTSNEFIPPYAKYSRKKDKYIWRDILDIGVSDEDGTILDFPFLNGCRYSYTRLPFNTLIEKNKTKKYRLNANDVSNIDSVNSVDDYLRNIAEDLFGNTNNGSSDDPFKPYTDEEC